ncbi:MAG: 30S ribosomal protein S13 [Candidatus Pacearchaeota archaeon]
MAEEKEKPKQEDKRQQLKQEEASLIRIAGKDIRGDKKLVVGLTKIKGISWAFSNAILKSVDVDGEKLVSEASDEEIEKIESFIKDPNLPIFLKNRQKDFDEGDDKHLTGADLKLRNEFDIKRLKKIKSYKGNRHTYGQPVRGQRTKSHFRTHRKKSGGIKK